MGPRARAPRARVVILGTSLTAGLGLDPSDAYPTLLQHMADSLKLHVNIVTAGLSGETSAGAFRRAAWVLEQPAAAVVLEVGANEILVHLFPRTNYGGELRRIVEQTLTGLNEQKLEHPKLPGRRPRFRLAHTRERSNPIPPRAATSSAT